jgi:hypothetical protein
MQKHPTPAETGFILLCIAAFASMTPALGDPPTVPAVPASAPTLGQTLDSFHPTPRQTIALRDFLGRSEKPVALGTQPNGLYLFDLRDAQNTRTGQIAAGVDPSDGSIFVARLGGPAVFDMTRRSAPPRVVNAKVRGAVSALLSGSLAAAPYESLTAKNRDAFLRDRPMLALNAQPVDESARVIETEASFYPDGSGFYRIVRATVGPGSAPAPLHVAAKFYPALESDGQKAFRAAVLGVDADFTASLADLGNKIACPTAGCSAANPSATVTLNGELHLTRWPHAVVPSAPANLIAQIAPPALPDILQTPYPPPGQNGPAVPPQPVR